ncbi:hypothetical protein TREMEDRAFT_30736, partial [Tremella mesenterica DSM 1558]|uniref:uncharacterized protein n=1 Tax=Tremella mesenterica (strain ATCC 24925 / CBS 8224 / DSM 1558 / NBRC 9311 / NRRL Y-6157 / RJB 2259-6 / UBC 559-6) TaxID=578456 RepID=UPI0003F491B6
PAAYISTSTDPWFNLSYEDWLLRNTLHNQPMLFLYRNVPCVVIGRNQNPWKETTPRKLKEWGIPLIRRRSGGGTVYHDMGNTNFSIFLPRLLFTRSHGAELIARAIRNRIGVQQCCVNSRNDIVIRDGINDFKVSGSAYKIIQHRAYHHGTMLISSDTSLLGKALKSSSPDMETKGIPSYRSPVTTLSKYSSQPITHENFVSAVIEEFEDVYGSGENMAVKEIREEEVVEKKVWEGIEEMKSWEWEFGQNPEFSNILKGRLSFGNLTVTLSARHARLTQIHFSLDESNKSENLQAFLKALSATLIGQKYELLDSINLPTDSAYAGHKWRKISEETITWLRATM